MRMRDFYAQCFRKAWRGKLLHVEAISGILTLLAIPIAAIWKPEVANINWLPLALFCVIFIGTIIYGFVTAPYWIAKGIKDERDKLQAELDNKAARENALNKLWDLRSAGISLRNDSVVSADNFEFWKTRFEQWKQDVLTEAGKVNYNLKCYLDRLDQLRPRPVGLSTFNSEHERLVCITSEMLQRLQEYLKQGLEWPSKDN
jgi:hypothetical protein